MKKLLVLLFVLLISTPSLTGCREENDKDIEVEELAPDVEDSGDDESFDTNPEE